MTDKSEPRKQIVDAWGKQQACFAVLEQTDAYKAYCKTKEHTEELYDEFGEPVGACESCGVPFFEDDRLFTYVDGEMVCLMDGNPTGKTGPCYGKLSGIITNA